jgi:dienelactone hydrolase
MCLICTFYSEKIIGIDECFSDCLLFSFGGEVVSTDIVRDHKKFEEFDFAGFISRNSKTIREPEIFESAIALRTEHKYARLGTIGFCFGGWAVFRLGALDVDLVDCIATAHPTFL